MPALPNLPSPPTGFDAWSIQVECASEVLSSTYRHATRALQVQSDASQLRFHANTIKNDILPLLYALERAAVRQPVPKKWLLKCAQMFGSLLGSLDDAEGVQQGE